jgi:hypothetical protein
MVKAKFRDHVRSKADVAMKNEVLAKIVAHNVCCLIMSQCELGIDVQFWGQAPEQASEVVQEAIPVEGVTETLDETEEGVSGQRWACAGA